MNMQRERAAEILSAMSGKTALVIGDVILDSFVYGAVQRISREAPAPILSETHKTDMLGGAGNLARNIVSLGGHAILLSAVGDDLEGQRVTTLAKQACGTGCKLVLAKNHATASKVRYIAKGQQMLCVDRNPEASFSDHFEAKLLEEVQAQLQNCDIVILSDYGRGLISPRFSRSVIDLASSAQKPVSVDPRGLNYSRYNGASLIKPNADELTAETGLSADTDKGAEIALKALKDKLPQTRALIVTRGASGMTLLEEGKITHHRSKPRDVYDVSGAGDTALAALSLSLATGVSLSDCMALADLAAGVAVSKPGTSIVSCDEILDDAGIGKDAPDWRVLSLEDATDLSQSWRSQGLKIGFTNGCFDILHPGHLSVLRFAASSCDRLFVGLNSDSSVSRLKGKDRPINKQHNRAVMLASLEMIDRVVVFEEDTPEALIKALRPNVMIKGADYSIDQLPGADFVQSYGGEILLSPLIDGLSTTGIVEKTKR